MAGKDLGTKHTCFKCGTKFYDFKKPEPLCPKCGADQRESPALKAPASERRQKAAKPPPREEEVEPTLDEEGDEPELDEEDEADDDGDSDDA
ncbi:MAG TPA: TIGR02300 family protein [Anaeromyxobacteraceae bacterium]|nr:TIGR02300 family protein [Anaeromyxobacteraceae bacterium]